MLAAEQLVKTERRYKARTEVRLAAERALEKRGILHADSPERVRRRLARLVAPTSPVAIAESGPPSADLIGLERLIGVNNFIDARFLRIGVAVARTVARIVVKDASGLILEYGTGFLVARGLLDASSTQRRDGRHPGGRPLRRRVVCRHQVPGRKQLARTAGASLHRRRLGAARL